VLVTAKPKAVPVKKVDAKPVQREKVPLKIEV